MSLSDEELKIKFPDAHYIGLREEHDGTMTAFATPEGTDSAAKKRKSTVYNWYDSGRSTWVNYGTRERKIKDTPEPTTHENKAMSGFKIENRLNRGGSWNGGQDKWKIEDPRGFVLEISGNNLQKIIEITTIVEGDIQGECIWARLGSDNILVPVGSELYKQAVVNTARSQQKIGLKHLTPGAYCIMQNGFEGFYQGKYYLVESDYGSDHAQRYITSDKEKYIFLEPKTNKLHHIATPKLAAFDHDKFSLLSEEELNEIASREQWYGGVIGHPNVGRAITSIKGPVAHRLTPYSGLRSELNSLGHRYMVISYIDGNMIMCSSHESYGASLVDQSLMYIKERQWGYSYGTDNMRNVTVDLRRQPELLNREKFVVDFIVKTSYGEHKIPL